MTFDLDGAAVVNMSGLQKHNETAITVAKGISGGSTTNAGLSSEDDTSFVEIQEEIRSNQTDLNSCICYFMFSELLFHSSLRKYLIVNDLFLTIL